jgi:hypothetical protein
LANLGFSHSMRWFKKWSTKCEHSHMLRIQINASHVLESWFCGHSQLMIQYWWTESIYKSFIMWNNFSQHCRSTRISPESFCNPWTCLKVQKLLEVFLLGTLFLWACLAQPTLMLQDCFVEFLKSMWVFFPHDIIIKVGL